MFQRIFGAALIAGLLAGLITAGLQHLTTTKLIIAAEALEQTPHGHDHGAAGASAASPAAADASKPAEPAGDHHHGDGWAPADGVERTVWTGTMTIIIAVGLALVLVALMALSDSPVDWRRGLGWGMGGFAAFSLLPSLGLSPELPGMPAAAIGDRQLWWVATVLASAIGLWLAVFARTAWMVGLGLVLLAAPHVIGAPLPSTEASAVPPNLAARFVATSLVMAAVLWALIGAIGGHLFGRWQTASN